jgi:hypothetical protein
LITSQLLLSSYKKIHNCGVFTKQSSYKLRLYTKMIVDGRSTPEITK